MNCVLLSVDCCIFDFSICVQRVAAARWHRPPPARRAAAGRGTSVAVGDHIDHCAAGPAHRQTARLDEEASGLAFITDKGSVAKNYYVNAAGRLLVNTPFETADLYSMMKQPNREEVEFS